MKEEIIKYQEHADFDGSDIVVSRQPLVRCKDCRHRPKLLVTDIEDMESGFDLQFPDYKCPCRNDGDEWYSCYPPDDWFCADGEK